MDEDLFSAVRSKPLQCCFDQVKRLLIWKTLDIGRWEVYVQVPRSTPSPTHLLPGTPSHTLCQQAAVGWAHQCKADLQYEDCRYVQWSV